MCQCTCSTKIMFYMISHQTLWDVQKTCFSPHIGGTAGAIFNVIGCQFRDPVLVEIRSKNSFYGHPFPSAVSIRATK